MPAPLRLAIRRPTVAGGRRLRAAGSPRSTDPESAPRCRSNLMQSLVLIASLVKEFLLPAGVAAIRALQVSSADADCKATQPFCLAGFCVEWALTPSA